MKPCRELQGQPHLAAIGLIFGAIQIYPILFPATPAPASTGATASRSVAAAHSIAEAPTTFTVTMVDSSRPTRKQIYETLTPIENARVSPLGEIDDWETLAKTIGCQRPDVVVAHLHSFRALKGQPGSEDFLFVGLRAIVQRSKETRFVLYSSTFGRAGQKAPGAVRAPIMTAPQAALRITVSAMASRIATDEAAQRDIANILAHSTFVVWPLPANLAEPNRQALRNAVAAAGETRAATRAPAAPLCRI